MSANIVNVVHKEGRQAGRQAGKKVGSLLFGPYIMPVFVRHAACNMLALLLATEQQQQQQARNCHS